MIANVEAENVVLAAMLQESSMIDRIADIVSPDDFADPLIARMFRASSECHATGRASGAVALNNMFEGDEAYESAGGRKWLVHLTSSSAALLGAVPLAKQIADLARRRRMVEGLTDAINAASDQSVPLSDTIEVADKAISEASTVATRVELLSSASCIDAMLAQLDSKDRGVMCKLIPPMDELLGGARRHQIIVLAGRPGMGKTAVALTYATGAAMNGHGVLFVSLEMSSTELGARQAADICFDGHGGVSYTSIINQEVTERDRQKLVQARDIAADIPMTVLDRGSIHVDRLNAILRQQARKFAAAGNRLDLVVIDYLQLLTAGKGLNPYERVSAVSMALKAMAKEHDVAIMALAQLSREVEKRPGKRPQLSDLRESGQIEQDADAVMFLLRNEYYLRKERPEMTDPDYMKWEQAMEQHAGKIEFICAKRRNGTEGSALGAFHGAYQAVRGL